MLELYRFFSTYVIHCNASTVSIGNTHIYPTTCRGQVKASMLAGLSIGIGNTHISPQEEDTSIFRTVGLSPLLSLPRVPKMAPGRSHYAFTVEGAVRKI